MRAVISQITTINFQLKMNIITWLIKTKCLFILLSVDSFNFNLVKIVELEKKITSTGKTKWLLCLWRNENSLKMIV